MLNINIAPKDTAEVQIKHPGTKEPLGVLIIAGPDHEATTARRRELDDIHMEPGYKANFQAEIQETLCKRTVGWKDIKDKATGDAVVFDPALLPGLYKQEWLRVQVLEGIGSNEVFFAA